MGFKEDFIEIAEKSMKEKTFIAPGDFTGTFSLEQDAEDEWWDKIVDQSRLVKGMGIRMTEGDKVYENELTLGSNGEDIFRPGTGGTDPGDTVTAGSAQRDFKPEEVVAVIPWTLDATESLKDGEEAYNKFLSMCDRAAANSIEKSVLHGVIAGLNNTQRGHINGCYDGILEQIRDGGNIVDATSGFTNRLVDIDGGVNDKFLAALNALPSKYDDGSNIFFVDPIVHRKVAALLEAKGFMVSDKFLRDGIYGGGVFIHGVDTFPLPLQRTNFLVQGTGTLTTADQVNGNGVAKARTDEITVDDTTGFIDTDTGVIGALSSGTAYGINAELFTVEGAPSATVLNTLVNLGLDHADNEFVMEYTAAPTANGHYAWLANFENMRLIVRRGMTVEIFREPRKRAWSVVLSMKLIPAFANQESGVLIRDLDA